MHRLCGSAVSASTWVEGGEDALDVSRRRRGKAPPAGSTVKVATSIIIPALCQMFCAD